jgi:hypothetical protein
MQVKRTCHIRALGALWMPNCPAVWQQSYQIGTGPFEHDIRCLADAEHRLTVDSGDLSHINDYEITFSISRTYPNPKGVGIVTHSRRWTPKPWKGGQEAELTFAFVDAAYVE